MNDFDPNDLSKNEAYEFASNERRRSLIRVLIEDGAQPLSRVVDEIVADIDDESENPSADPHRRVRVALGHTDIPTLSAADVISYDYAAEVVSPDEHLDELEPLV